METVLPLVPQRNMGTMEQMNNEKDETKLLESQGGKCVYTLGKCFPILTCWIGKVFVRDGDPPIKY